MKLIRKDGDEFEFEFELIEKGLLFHLLGLYPVVPLSYHKLTKGRRIPNKAENQALLNEAITAQREEHQRAIIALLKEPDRFAAGEGFIRAVFQRGELEWLLQVLNDVRVGNWIAAGSPDLQDEERPQPSPKTLQNVMLMELTDGFQILFLGALSGALEPGVDIL